MNTTPDQFQKGVAAVAEAANQATPTPETPKPAPTEAAVVQAPPNTMAPRGEAMDDFAGELSQDDIKIPKLNIAQAIGPLSDDWPKGAWVLNRAMQLAAAGEELHFTPITASKSFVEATEYGDEEMPKVFRTKQEAIDAGLRVDFDSATGEKPQINSCLDVILLIRSTDPTPPLEFSLSFDGESYALARWTIGSWSAYNSAAKTLLTARTMHLKSFMDREWVGVSEKKVLGNGNTTMVPVIRAKGNNTDEFKEWARSLVK